MSIGLLIFIFIILLPFFWGMGAYNRLVGLRNRVKNAFAQIDVQLKRRYDLIPNLVETAKAYMQHEAGTLEAVIAARDHAVRAKAIVGGNPANTAAMSELNQAENALSGTLGHLFALSEAYPDLKANQNMMQLTEELTSTENKIAFARQGYNDNVMSYNTGIEQFPASIIAGAFRFHPSELLQATESAEEKKPVKVQF